MEFRGRTRGLVLIGFAVVMLVINWALIRFMDKYYPALTFLIPVCITVGLAYAIAPSIEDEPRDTKHNAILWGSCGVGAAIGAVALYLMGFLG